MIKIHACPNSDCTVNKQGSHSAKKPFYIKKGFYKTKYNHQPVPRYQCKFCGKNFSSHSFRETKKQHRPDINQQVFAMISSGVTLRRTAIILGVTKKTVERKFQFISKLAEKAHQIFLSKEENKTSYVQFDEMESYEHTKCKPLSIAIAVRAKTGHIIDAKVAVMRCKGKLAPISQFKYPYWNKDRRAAACTSVLKSVKKLAKDSLTIASDAKRAYIPLINNIFPEGVEHDQHISRKGVNGSDPLFRLNHTAARIRADMSRMRRRTWSCTKKWRNLQKHLYIYIAWNNKYCLKLNHC